MDGSSILPGGSSGGGAASSGTRASDMNGSSINPGPSTGGDCTGPAQVPAFNLLDAHPVQPDRSAPGASSSVPDEVLFAATLSLPARRDVVFRGLKVLRSGEVEVWSRDAAGARQVIRSFRVGETTLGHLRQLARDLTSSPGGILPEPPPTRAGQTAGSEPAFSLYLSPSPGARCKVAHYSLQSASLAAVSDRFIATVLMQLVSG